MERREFVTAFGALAAAAAASSALAAGEEHAHHMSHGAKYKALLESSAKCASSGEECLRHCFEMLAMNDASMGACTKATYDVVAACSALAKLAGTNSTFTPALAKVVADVCLACKKECDKFPAIAECKACGDACQACADECRKAA
ncbi:four-helix bundle copper-binding protein [Methylosinus sp. Sm6]|uniref:four-helix bundle copper-binding protein n=1 Tax=Methylosinus sp. Sm6 TaxID=2866948 RepID=UPI001C998EF6|nr:four-helix bundle copper-binding protein [Methylosinus sp. Sm6]MBY6241811.1 four-helix bundle copper-binding protein [Methylosinus sp. Sm6]